jgi:hypothetical protein
VSLYNRGLLNASLARGEALASFVKDSATSINDPPLEVWILSFVRGEQLASFWQFSSNGRSPLERAPKEELRGGGFALSGLERSRAP